jgi:CheY-like chemotaxis protein
MARIMVVDDERDVVTLIRFMLEKDGHQVTEAYNGEQALEKASQGLPPDLMILDVMMPVMDGYTLSARLSDDIRTRGIPLLILTAKGDMRDLFELAPNVAAYIEKPFDPKTLRELVNGMLKREAA